MRRSALVAALLVAVACTGGGRPTPMPVESAIPMGGTLRVLGGFPDTLDPQKAYNLDAWELFRCCLLRTLLSYNGHPTDRGGSELHPDLAAAMPDVSADRMTWTFHLKRGIHYGPPFEHTEIVAQDIVRGLLRMKVVPRSAPQVSVNYAFYYSVIQGFDGYFNGHATNIAGLQTPDDHTLVVRLTQPAGDLGYRLALPGAAPIPPSPLDPQAIYGAATGHGDDYGGFLVASGPYMLAGSRGLDFTKPPDQQAAVSGFRPFRSLPKAFHPGRIVLVRNPSWERPTDDLRGAYVDRIVFDLGTNFRGSPEPAIIEDGRWDVGFDFSVRTPWIKKYRSDPRYRDQLNTDGSNGVGFIAMNLAVPPLDDLHVRRAVSLAVDLDALVRLRDTWHPGTVPHHDVLARHLAPDAMEGSLLISYRPRWSSAKADGDLKAARAEMRLAPRYDRDGDGRCDVPVCHGVVMVLGPTTTQGMAPVLKEGFRDIGITLRIRSMPFDLAEKLSKNPANRVPLTAIGWEADYPNGSALFPFLFFGPAIGVPATMDLPLLGATPEQLAGWHYPVQDVPSVDGQIEQCQLLIGHAAVTCWAELDKYLMEKVVPWIPYFFTAETYGTSSRVARYSFDQFVSLPALDQIAVKQGST